MAEPVASEDAKIIMVKKVAAKYAEQTDCGPFCFCYVMADEKFPCRCFVAARELVDLVLAEQAKAS